MHVAVAPAGADLRLGAAAAAAVRRGRDERAICGGCGALAAAQLMPTRRLQQASADQLTCIPGWDTGVAYAASSARSSRLARAICLLVVVRLTVSSAAISR